MDELKNYAINQNRRGNVCKNNDYSRENTIYTHKYHYGQSQPAKYRYVTFHIIKDKKNKKGQPFIWAVLSLFSD